MWAYMSPASLNLVVGGFTFGPFCFNYYPYPSSRLHSMPHIPLTAFYL